jgi:phosphatidylinositol alpha-1,6-mannosyltransferase
MPSRGEGFGLVYIEAMRQGVPVIASIHDGAREVNVDGETGYNVDLDQSGELTARLITLLSHPVLRHRMGAAGQQRWHEHFRLACLRSRLLPLIETLLP